MQRVAYIALGVRHHAPGDHCDFLGSQASLDGQEHHDTVTLRVPVCGDFGEHPLDLPVTQRLCLLG
jgi:hypothetical protein